VVCFSTKIPKFLKNDTYSRESKTNIKASKNSRTTVDIARHNISSLAIWFSTTPNNKKLTQYWA